MGVGRGNGGVEERSMRIQRERNGGSDGKRENNRRGRIFEIRIMDFFPLIQAAKEQSVCERDW